MKLRIDPSLAIEAKAITAFAFRNGPIEDSDEEMKRIMKLRSMRCIACSGSAITIPKLT